MQSLDIRSDMGPKSAKTWKGLLIMHTMKRALFSGAEAKELAPPAPTIEDDEAAEAEGDEGGGGLNDTPLERRRREARQKVMQHKNTLVRFQWFFPFLLH